MSLDVKIAVCDDEVYFQDRIKELLQKYFKENGLAVSIDLYESGALSAVIRIILKRMMSYSWTLKWEK